jgi:integrase
LSKGIWDAKTWDTGDNRHDEGALLTWVQIKDLVCAAKRAEGRQKDYIGEYARMLDRAAAWCERQTPPIPPQRFGFRAAEKHIKDTKQNADAIGEPCGERRLQVIGVRLKTVFSLLYDQGLFPKNNLERLKPPKVDIHSPLRPRYAITQTEYRAIIEANWRLWSPEHDPSSRFKGEVARKFHPLRNECLITMMIDGGMRRGEVCQLRLSDINMDTGIVMLSKEITKAKKGRITALSMGFVRGPLTEWVALRNRLMSGHDDPGTLFITELRTVVTPDSWSKRFDRIVDAAGLDRKITTHACRRAASTNLDMVDKETSKLMVGHESDAVHDLYHVVGPAQIAKIRAVKDAAGMWWAPPT